MLIDTEKLRDGLADYYGTAAFNGFSPAFGDLVTLGNLTGVELCELAESEGFNLEEYRAE